MRFLIRHLSGSKAGQEEILAGPVVTVGRDPANTLRFDPHADDRVSANHAQLLLQDNGQVLLTDLGSSNGTFVGEQRITAPVPIATGAVLRFGEGGPQVSVTFLPPEASPPVAPPKKGPPKGLIIAAAVLAFLLLAGCVTSLLLYLGGSDEPASPPAGSAAADAAAHDGAPESSAATEPAEETPPAESSSKEHVSPWAALGVGTVFEFETTTEMTVAGNKTRTTSRMRQTLKAKDDEVATVLYETIVQGAPPTTSEQKVPLHAEGEGEQPTYLEEKKTEVEVPAGTFSCTYRKWTQKQGGQESTVEMWIDESLPVAYKTVVTNSMMTSTTVLASMDKK
ncbi:MAG: FHA domain-containing protein [Planctomycetota bacterium]|nr:MAG: FHA domain-containing protein [Planctomycetota bacterium]